MNANSKTLKNSRYRPGVLIIEDNPDHWRLMEGALKHYLPQAKLVWVTDEQGAVAHLDECAIYFADLPRLILLDLYLPTREHGFQVLQRIKSHAQYRQIPVVMISYSDDPVDIVEAYDQGANSYCLKPIDPTQWLVLFGTLKNYWFDICALHERPGTYNPFNG